MNINHAILHVFDFEGAGTTYSARELQSTSSARRIESAFAL